MAPDTDRLTTATLDLDRLAANLRLLTRQAGGTAVWPVIKGDAYGHGALAVGRHLERLGCRTLCVADVHEAAALLDAGLRATFVTLSPTLPRHAEALVAYGCEPVVCTREMVDALDRAARRRERRVRVHLAVETGMGRVGIPPADVPGFLEHCAGLPGVRVVGLMSHFARANEVDKASARQQLERFRTLIATLDGAPGLICHMANSAAVLDLPEARFDAVRPGIALYGLCPSWEIADPAVHELRPALEWSARIVLLKEVPAGTGLSYGHDFITERPSLIATVPVGYADGLRRALSGRMEMIVRGVRCPQVGRITMDLSLLDVTALRGRVAVGDEVVILGERDGVTQTADDLAATLGTINYEIVSAISHRVHRAVSGGALDAAASS